jgi:hypothetical protein
MFSLRRVIRNSKPRLPARAYIRRNAQRFGAITRFVDLIAEALEAAPRA